MKKQFYPLFLLILLCVSAVSADKWLDFAVDDHLSVSLPIQPAKMVKDTVEADGFEQHLQVFSCYDEYGSYRISRDDLHHESDNYLTPEGRKEWYSVGPLVEGMRGAKFLRRETFSIDGVDGVDRVYQLPAVQGRGRTLKYVRTLLVGKVGYEFWFIPNDGLNSPRPNLKKRFFNSIKLHN